MSTLNAAAAIFDSMTLWCGADCQLWYWRWWNPTEELSGEKKQLYNIKMIWLISRFSGCMLLYGNMLVSSQKYVMPVRSIRNYVVISSTVHTQVSCISSDRNILDEFNQMHMNNFVWFFFSDHALDSVCEMCESACAAFHIWFLLNGLDNTITKHK